MMKKTYPILFFVLLISLAFWKVLFQPEYTLLTGGDMCSQTYPWFAVASHWIKRGVLVLWDPYVYGGKANLGELQPAVLYPLNWIFQVLPSGHREVNLPAMEGFILLHFMLAGYFCYLLARSFDISPFGSALTGTAFALGGYTPQLYGFVNIFSGYVWMPLVLLFYRKALLSSPLRLRLRHLLWAGGALTLSLLAGHHIGPIHTGLFLFLYSCFEACKHPKRFRWGVVAAIAGSLALVALTALLLGAVQWLPSAEWARLVWRWIGGAAEPVKWGDRIPYSILQQTANLNPQDLVSLLLPYVATSASIYVGAAVLFFSLVGLLFTRRGEARFFGVAAFFYLFLSWGQFSAIHGWMNTFIPGLWFAREVSHYLVSLQLCLAILAGWGLDYVVAAYADSVDAEFRHFIRRAGWGMAIVVLGAGTLMVANSVLRNVPFDHPYIRGSAALAVYVSILGCLLFLLHTGRIGPGRFRLMSLLLVIVDLASHASMDVRTNDRPRGASNPSVQLFWKRPPIADRLVELRKHDYFRADDPAAILPPNFGDSWLVESTMGHGATGLVRYMDFRGAGWAPAANPNALLNARYFLSRHPVPGMKKIFGEQDSIYFNPRAVPRAFVAARYRAFSSYEKMLEWVPTPLLAPRETVLLKEDDVRRLPREFIEGAVNEDDGIDVEVLSRLRQAERGADRLTDEGARQRVFIYHAPWGWSVGDEVSLALRPKGLSSHGYLIVNYIPTSSEPSVIPVHLEDSRGKRELTLELPGLLSGEAEPDMPRQGVLDLGALEPGECRLSFARPAECSANIDSVRVSRSTPSGRDLDSGQVLITSFQPNRLRLNAELRRPSFVVVSEVFYPGWEALVDGKRSPLLCGDYILRAVPVPAGKHEIVLRFRSRTFELGLAVTLVSLLVIVVVLKFSTMSGRSSQ